MKKYSARLLVEQMRNPEMRGIPSMVRWRKLREYGPWPIAAVSREAGRELVVRDYGPLVTGVDSWMRVRVVMKPISEAEWMRQMGVPALIDVPVEDAVAQESTYGEG